MKYTHEYWMKFALEEAKKAMLIDEIPVAAIAVKNDELVFSAHNLTRQQQNPLAHAEKLVIDELLKKEKYLYNYTLYITLEPCMMCAGSIILSRVGTVVFGAKDMKSGACGSIYNVLKDQRFNHQPNLVTGVLHEECADILRVFFEQKRINTKL
ncbi:MAG TPA: tRNA adenosine(34) deaminase TadA [Candidatus Cloacimonadota bacterium]|jgi:tRNA(adenine34) deaminase|nr:tRNA adenosine(34) deaminase TadA [Candidatus Cloacimonadales bacterium]HPY96065.1 tRNA adenosine(34) deaminase TadA [Candidatus Cloacimonadota bacterium]HQB40486.1 tRNA adenosine(34) deaminase TadA [Candidatus Cloacimonadota bacterium]